MTSLAELLGSSSKGPRLTSMYGGSGGRDVPLNPKEDTFSARPVSRALPGMASTSYSSYSSPAPSTSAVSPAAPTMTSLSPSLTSTPFKPAAYSKPPTASPRLQVQSDFEPTAPARKASDSLTRLKGRGIVEQRLKIAESLSIEAVEEEPAFKGVEKKSWGVGKRADTSKSPVLEAAAVFGSPSKSSFDRSAGMLQSQSRTVIPKTQGFPNPVTAPPSPAVVPMSNRLSVKSFVAKTDEAFGSKTIASPIRQRPKSWTTQALESLPHQSAATPINNNTASHSPTKATSFNGRPTFRHNYSSSIDNKSLLPLNISSAQPISPTFSKPTSTASSPTKLSFLTSPVAESTSTFPRSTSPTKSQPFIVSSDASFPSLTTTGRASPVKRHTLTSDASTKSVRDFSTPAANNLVYPPSPTKSSASVGLPVSPVKIASSTDGLRVALPGMGAAGQSWRDMRAAASKSSPVQSDEERVTSIRRVALPGMGAGVRDEDNAEPSPREAALAIMGFSADPENISSLKQLPVEAPAEESTPTLHHVTRDRVKKPVKRTTAVIVNQASTTTVTSSCQDTSRPVLSQKSSQQPSPRVLQTQSSSAKKENIFTLPTKSVNSTPKIEPPILTVKSATPVKIYRKPISPMVTASIEPSAMAPYIKPSSRPASPRSASRPVSPNLSSRSVSPNVGSRPLSPNLSAPKTSSPLAPKLVTVVDGPILKPPRLPILERNFNLEPFKGKDIEPISTEVFSIIRDDARPIKFDKHIFYDTEVLAIFFRYKEWSNSGLVNTMVWRWTGVNASAGQAEFSKVARLAGAVNKAPVVIQQSCEPPELMVALGHKLTTRHGQRQLFTNDTTQAYLVRNFGPETFIDQIDITTGAITSASVVVLAILDQVFTWEGRGALKLELEVATSFAQDLAGGRKVMHLREGFVGKEDDTLFFSAFVHTTRSQVTHHKWRRMGLGFDERLWEVEYGSPTVRLHQRPFNSNSIRENRVTIAVLQFEVWLIVGQDARSERSVISTALRIAEAMSLQMSRSGAPFKPPVHVIIQPTSLPLELRLALREVNSHLNPPHMNMLTFNDAIRHLDVEAWNKKAMPHHDFLPLGISPSDLS